MSNEIMTDLQYQALVLVQALLGVISPNFRMVWISVEEIITIYIVLEVECDEDVEEIEDLGAKFEALQEVSLDYEIKTLINDGNLLYPDVSRSLIVFKRREV